MKITKLVVLFNLDKIIVGCVAAAVLTVAGLYTTYWFSYMLLIGAGAIVLNIVLALVASYLLYDSSALYRPAELFGSLPLGLIRKAIFLHASFDPMSRELQLLMSKADLKIYNIYGNRHADEKSVAISNKVFPPNPREEIVDPTQLQDATASVDCIFAITSLHEIHTQEDRVKFFKEARRVLKDDGSIIICEQLRDWTNFLFFNIGAFHFVSSRHWRQAIAEAGLQIEKCEKITPWGTVFYVNKA